MSKNRWVETRNGSFIILETGGQIMQIAFWDPGTEKNVYCAVSISQNTHNITGFLQNIRQYMANKNKLQLNVFPDVSHILSN